jgi:rare lipoprotein A (peptidoglycan hydrolase)
MKADAAKDKINFQLESAYRSYEHQAELYEAYKRGTGNLAAAPGTSDHGLGKAIDLYPTAAQEWVRRNGRKYGWYWPPETGEPWHFVYVGGGRLEPPKQQVPGQQPQIQIPDAQNYGVKDGEQKRVKYNNKNYVIARDKGKWRVYKVNPTTGLLEEVDRTDQSFVKVLDEYRKTQSPTSPKPQQPPGQQPAKKSYNGLTSFYGVSGNEPELKGTRYEKKPDRFGYDPDKKTTASGAPFIPSGLTAAHKTLPFGTKLRVTNPNNGKSVIVTVNDRGPFSGNRVLDLSYGAAKAIDMVRSGEINAKIEELKGGGYIPKQSPDRKVSSLNSYPSYAQGGNSILIVEKMVPVPMPVPVKGRRSGSNYFAVAGVNNTASPLSIG